MSGLSTANRNSDAAINVIIARDVQRQCNAVVWLQRAKVAFDRGNMKLYHNLTAQAALEIRGMQ